MRLVFVMAFLAISSRAYAGDKLVDVLDARFEDVFGPDPQEDAALPRFALVGGDVIVAPKSAGDAMGGHGEQSTFRMIAGLSSDKTAAWYAADLAEFEPGCGAAPCPPPPPPPPAELHAVAVFEKSGADWKPIVWSVAPVVAGKDQAASIKRGDVPGAMPAKNDGADDALAVFGATIGDPKALAKSVSSRKDAVLYGSEASERVIGGAKVAAKLTGWNLAFKVRDGVSAGVSSSKTVAWIAANLDATSKKKPKDKPVPYRALFVYEKQGADWKLVVASFAYLTGD
ncbi:MAG TPA: hypothetical protein VL463_02700 [Kofleriaceae bacterium]|nr:hypothetical protein [Kofleriaceae bacterium]